MRRGRGRGDAVLLGKWDKGGRGGEGSLLGH